MSSQVFYVGFILSLIFSLFSAIIICRKIYQTGIECFSSRILIYSAIVNTFLCSLLFIWQGIDAIQTLWKADSFQIGQLISPLIFLLIPIRILWNFISIQRKTITRFDLIPHKANESVCTITALCKTMNISCPTVLSSNRVILPFVFGKRSSESILAIPAGWRDINSKAQQVQLMHELAHVRNRDIGFLAWSNACIWDLKILLAPLSILILYCYILDYNQMVSSLILFLACSLVLFILLRNVVRKRELLADMTAAMLIESSKIKDTLFQSGAFKDPLHTQHQSTFKFGDKINRWLTDKALFSKKQRFYNDLLRIFRYFYMSHPSKSKRIDAIESTGAFSQNAIISLGDSLWAGVTMGLIGIVVMISGYWITNTYHPHLTNDANALKQIYQMYTLASPIAIGYLSIYLILPVWASLKRPDISKGFLRIFFTRGGVLLFGAFLPCPLVLTVAPVSNQSFTLLTLFLIWQALVTFFAFAINIILISLWLTIRYLQAGDTKELKKGIRAFGGFAAVVFAFIIMACILIEKNFVFQGINVALSTIAGGSLVSISVKNSLFSESEHYIIFQTPFFGFRMEGKKYRSYAFIFNSLCTTTLLLIYTFFICLLNHFLFSWLFEDFDSTLGIFVACTLCCTIMVLLEWYGSKKGGLRKRLKIYKLYMCLKSLSKQQPAEYLEKITHIAASAGLKDRQFFNRPLNLTTGDIYELYHLTKETSPELSQRAIEWVLRCQQGGGFSLWPQSDPRLVSTYQAISILRASDRLDAVHFSEHISWIKSLQQPDGSSKDPWSKRDTWEDTFFAVQSLNILQTSLEPDDAKRCDQWARGILRKGIEKDNPNRVYHSIGILKALGQLDDHTRDTTSDWLCGKVEKLLLTNIGLNYENVHFVVMTYDILSRETSLSSMTPQIKLLANRIQTALEAELADIRP